MLGQMMSVCLPSKKLSNCFPVYLNHATCLPAMNESSGTSHACQHVVWPGLLVSSIVAIQVDLYLCLIVVLICIFDLPVTTHVEHPFICLAAMCIF